MPTAPKQQNPDWNEDEHILALDLYLSCKPAQPQKGSADVRALSELLNRLHQRLGTRALPTLRNPDGVYMKLMNLKAHDSEYVALGRKGLARGNRLEAQVWRDFGGDLPRLSRVAATIRSFILSATTESALPRDDDDDLAPEGRLLTRVHKGYERNPKNRQRKLLQFKRDNGGRLSCECCGFDFERVYGTHGAGFIECHHTVPVSTLTPATKLRLSDLRLVCSNCHRMLHHKQPWLAYEALAQLIKSAKNADTT